MNIENPTSDTPLELSISDLIDNRLFRNDKDFNVLINKLELSHLRLENRKALLNFISSHRGAVAVNDEIGHVTIKPHVSKKTKLRTSPQLIDYLMLVEK